MRIHRALSVSLLLLAACARTSEPPGDGAGDRPPPAAVESVSNGPPPSTAVGDETPRVDNSVVLTSPEPFSGNVSGPLQFEVDVPPDVRHADVEASIRVRSRDGALVPGAFSWEEQPKPGSPRNDFRLTFTPREAWAAGGDFSVTVVPTGSFNPQRALHAGARKNSRGEWKTGFDTASGPRVARVRIVSKDMQNIVALHVRLSTLTDVASVRAALAVTANGAPVPGKVDLESGAARDFVYTLAQPLPKETALTLTLGVEVKATTGEPLNLRAWSAESLETDRISVDLSHLEACPCDGGCWEWRPPVAF
jgi:hypothetical protein